MEKTVSAKVKDDATTDDKGMIRVLVYGTLKKGHSNHILLEEAGAQFIGYDSVTGDFTMYDMGAIPAVVDSEAGQPNKIRGELWAIDPEGLASLDLLEGHPNFYQRRKLWTDVHGRRAWMYFMMIPDYLPKDPETKGLGLWHASHEENKFWLGYKGGKAA
jgi:gamma-glutamylaminecyclotransferase